MNAVRRLGMVAPLALAALIACDTPSAESDEVAVDGSAGQPRPGERAAPIVPVEAVFEAHVIYLGLDIAPPKLTPGDRAVITQYWRLNTPLSAVERRTLAGWTSYLRVEGPYGRGAIAAQRLAPAEGLSLERWAVGNVIKEEFTVQVPEDWSEPAVWLFAGIGANSTDPSPTNSLKVLQGPDEDGWRIRALTVRVKRPWSGGLPSWVAEARPMGLSKFVE